MKLLWTLALFILSGHALAQGFNIDAGSNPSTLPPVTYGAAAGQLGVWNAAIGGTAPIALVDLTGAATAVVLNPVDAYGQVFDNPDTSRGDQDLMDDVLNTEYSGTWQFVGLAEGDYLVYTYSPVPGTIVSVYGSPDTSSTIGGPWPGAFVQGITHSVHHVHIGQSQTLHIAIVNCGFCDPIFAGFQIVPDVPESGSSFCDPGSSGVLSCPCSNPPSTSERGCDNSSASGGARLSAHGIASLSADTLFLSVVGERPNSTSVVSQGDATIAGLPFGQGVRCVGGHLKRLYTKTASGGTIGAPLSGDATVSLRSAQLGDPITAGAQRFYYVYYRDPIVLGGCPSTSTFNTTQSVLVLWSM